MKIDLPPLPYSYTALEPEISKTTLEIHHDKHHAKYVNVANQMIEGTEMEGDDSEALLMKAHKAGNQGLFNNAAQSWNHAFYWDCMKPSGGGEPTGTARGGRCEGRPRISDRKERVTRPDGTAHKDGHGGPEPAPPQRHVRLVPKAAHGPAARRPCHRAAAVRRP